MVTAPAIDEWCPNILRRVVLASLIGTTIEWYDFFLYGFMSALVFSGWPA